MASISALDGQSLTGSNLRSKAPQKAIVLLNLSLTRLRHHQRVLMVPASIPVRSIFRLQPCIAEVARKAIFPGLFAKMKSAGIWQTHFPDSFLARVKMPSGIGVQ